MMKLLLASAALALLSACSADPADPATNLPAQQTPLPTEPAAPDTSASPLTPAPSTSLPVLGLEGLDSLRIGQPVAAGSGWAERGAQISDGCRIVTSPRYDGVYAIVEGGKVRRITLSKADVRLAEGIGVGATEAEVRQWFGGFTAEPHKYEAAPAKYLTAPNAASGDSALRFEIGGDGKVKHIHVGTMPVLAYVEGCA